MNNIKGEINKENILFEDNHLIVVNKMSGVLVQGDKTGDISLLDQIKKYLKIKYKKSGKVFLGLVHRIDRPTSGVVIFAKTSKSLIRLNKQFQERKIKKTYWAITEKKNNLKSQTIKNWLKKNKKQNKSYVYHNKIEGSKIAELKFSLLKVLKNYMLLEINPITGRHHQIRAQLSDFGMIIKGDLKYGSKRNNLDGSIDLHARNINFEHPVEKKQINIEAPTPKREPWVSVFSD
tara:strand:- start:8069 stop:8770 length:702 start_codon:yes stop_codon:yes gene_type:complete